MQKFFTVEKFFRYFLQVYYIIKMANFSVFIKHLFSFKMLERFNILQYLYITTFWMEVLIDSKEFR